MTPDAVNGAFEFAGSLLTLMNTRRVWKDKGYAGVFVPAIVFFTAWGAWNLYYYPHLSQWWSFAGGVSLVVANICWVGSLWWFGKRP